MLGSQERMGPALARVGLPIPGQPNWKIGSIFPSFFNSIKLKLLYCCRQLLIFSCASSSDKNHCAFKHSFYLHAYGCVSILPA